MTAERQPGLNGFHAGPTAAAALPRVSFSQKEMLMGYLLRSRAIFLEARRILEPEMFTESYERVYAVIWRCMRDYWDAHHEMPPQPLLEMEFDTRAESHPDEVTPEMRAEGLHAIDWIYRLNPDTDLPDGGGLDLLQKFCRERLVHDPQREYWQKIGDFNPADLPAMLQSVIRTSDIVESLRHRQQTSLFLENERDPERRVIPTGFEFLDETMAGGRSAGETYVLYGATGAGKTTLAAILSGKAAVREASEAQIAGRRADGVAYFTYEAPPREIRRIVVSNLARVNADHLEGKMQNWRDTLSSVALGRPLHRYESLLEVQGSGNGPQRGEWERVQEVQPLLRDWHVWNMSPHPEDPSAGSGYIDEIRRNLDRHRREGRQGWTCVFIDFMQDCVDRHLETKVVRDLRGDTTKLLSDFVKRVNRQIAVEFNCSVFITAQLNGAALNFAPGRRVTPVDALGCKTTHINAFFTWQLGNPDRREHAVVLYDGKTRRGVGSNRDHVILRQRAAYRDLYPAELVLEGNILRPSDPTVMAQQPTSRPAARASRGRGGESYRRVDVAQGLL